MYALFFCISSKKFSNYILFVLYLSTFLCYAITIYACDSLQTASLNARITILQYYVDTIVFVRFHSSLNFHYRALRLIDLRSWPLLVNSSLNWNPELKMCLISYVKIRSLKKCFLWIDQIGIESSSHLRISGTQIFRCGWYEDSTYCLCVEGFEVVLNMLYT